MSVQALEAGAHGAFLSGAGPTVLAITGGVGIGDVGSDTMSQFLAEGTPPPYPPLPDRI